MGVAGTLALSGKTWALPDLQELFRHGEPQYGPFLSWAGFRGGFAHPLEGADRGLPAGANRRARIRAGKSCRAVGGRAAYACFPRAEDRFHRCHRRLGQVGEHQEWRFMAPADLNQVVAKASGCDADRFLVCEPVSRSAGIRLCATCAVLPSWPIPTAPWCAFGATVRRPRGTFGRAERTRAPSGACGRGCRHCGSVHGNTHPDPAIAILGWPQPAHARPIRAAHEKAHGGRRSGEVSMRAIRSRTSRLAFARLIRARAKC